MKSRKKLMIIIMMIIGCGGGSGWHTNINKGIKIEEIEIMVDKNFNEEEDRAIYKSISNWNYALNGWIEIKVINWRYDMEEKELEEGMRGEIGLILKRYMGNQIREGVEVEVLGETNKIGGRIISLNYKIDDEKVLNHEIGHMLGMGHRGYKSEVLYGGIYGLMKKSYNLGYGCISEEDMEEIGKIYKIEKSGFNWCNKLNK